MLITSDEIKSYSVKTALGGVRERSLYERKKKTETRSEIIISLHPARQRAPDPRHCRPAVVGRTTRPSSRAAMYRMIYFDLQSESVRQDCETHIRRTCRLIYCGRRAITRLLFISRPKNTRRRSLGRRRKRFLMRAY